MIHALLQEAVFTIRIKSILAFLAGSFDKYSHFANIFICLFIIIRKINAFS